MKEIPTATHPIWAPALTLETPLFPWVLFMATPTPAADWGAGNALNTVSFPSKSGCTLASRLRFLWGPSISFPSKGNFITLRNLRERYSSKQKNGGYLLSPDILHLNPGLAWDSSYSLSADWAPMDPVYIFRNTISSWFTLKKMFLSLMNHKGLF